MEIQADLEWRLEQSPGSEPDGWAQREIAEYQKILHAGAVVVDGSGYYAALKTQGDFSCNRWEAK